MAKSNAQKSREWRERNPDYYRERYAAQKDEINECAGEWQRANPDRVREIQRRHRAKHPEKRRAANRRGRQRRRGHNAPDAEARDYATILAADPCSYCGRPVAPEVDHIEALDAGGDPVRWDNTTAACRSCNGSKGSKPLLVFLLDHLHAGRRG